MVPPRSGKPPATVPPILTLFLSVFVVATIFPIGEVRGASIVADGSLGTRVTAHETGYRIDSGTVLGGNQFHSFHKFNLFSGECASFDGPANIDNIISRVTGGRQSFVDGTIRSEISGANLYVINPSGVVFGPGARLDVSGSFHVSTADYLRLSEGGMFRADLSGNSVLTAQPPTAFGFLDGNPDGIRIREAMLEVPGGETLSIVGGDIDISGDENGRYASSRVAASGGALILASVKSPGEIRSRVGTPGLDSNLAGVERLGEIVISRGALITASGEGNGTVMIRGGRLHVDRAHIAADSGGASAGNATGIDIAVRDDLSVVNGGSVTTNTYGSAPAGDVIIDADRVLLAGIPMEAPSIISSSSTWVNGVSVDITGNSGDITITGSELRLEDAAYISSSSYYGWGGNAGDVTIHARNVFMSGPVSSPDPFNTDFTGIYSTPGYYGNGGNLSIYADSLTMANRSQLDLSAYGYGRGGNLLVDAGRVEILSGAEIIASAFGAGDGGECAIRADHLLISGVSPEIYTDITGHESLAPSGIASQTGLSGGSAGGVNIEAGSMHISDGARIGVETFGPGNGGDIHISVDNDLVMSGVNADLAQVLRDSGNDTKFAGASILAAAYSFYLGDAATGNGGSIAIDAGSIVMTEGALISSETESPGDGGTIDVSSDTTFSIGSGASIAASSTKAWSNSIGKSGNIRLSAGSGFLSSKGSVTTAAEQNEGGNIDISAPAIDLTDRSIVSARAGGKGNAGEILMTATDTFRMIDSSVATESTISDGGNITVNAGKIVNLWGSDITASVGGGPDTVGGNIRIDPKFVNLSESRIVANAYEGRGGNIVILADAFLADENSAVDASSRLGIDGEVDMPAPTKHLAEGLKPLTEKYRQALSLLRKPCVARIQKGKYSSLVVGPRTIMPIAPGGMLPSPLSP